MSTKNENPSDSYEYFIKELMFTYKKTGAIKYVSRLIKTLKSLPQEDERDLTIENLKKINYRLKNKT